MFRLTKQTWSFWLNFNLSLLVINGALIYFFGQDVTVFGSLGKLVSVLACFMLLLNIAGLVIFKDIIPDEKDYHD